MPNFSQDKDRELSRRFPEVSADVTLKNGKSLYFANHRQEWGLYIRRTDRVFVRLFEATIAEKIQASAGLPNLVEALESTSTRNNKAIAQAAAQFRAVR